jgi:hypothetical protein
MQFHLIQDFLVTTQITFDSFSIVQKLDDNYYQVIIDQKTNEIGFIKKIDRAFRFETVVEYVNEWTEMGSRLRPDSKPSKERAIRQRVCNIK